MYMGQYLSAVTGDVNVSVPAARSGDNPNTGAIMAKIAQLRSYAGIHPVIAVGGAYLLWKMYKKSRRR